MSIFGGPVMKAAASVSESMHGNIEQIFKGDGIERPHTARVRLSATGQLVKGVIYSGKIAAEGPESMVNMSVHVTRAGGRLIILN